MKLEPRRCRDLRELQVKLTQEDRGPLTQAVARLMGSYTPASLPLDVVIGVGPRIIMIMAIDYEEGHSRPLVVHRWLWLGSKQIVRGQPYIWFIDAHGTIEQPAIAESWDICEAHVS